MVSIQKSIESLLGSTVGFMVNISTRNLARQRRNTILTLIVIIVSMATFVLSVSVVASASLEVTEYTVGQSGSDAILKDYQEFITTEQLTELNSLDEVTAVIPRIRLLGKLTINQLIVSNSSGQSRSIYLPLATDYALEETYSGISTILESGSLPTNEYDVCISSDIATELNISVGDKITVKTIAFTDTTDYTVTGIIDTDKFQSYTDFTGNYLLPEDYESGTHSPVSAVKSAFFSFNALWRILPTIRDNLINVNSYNEVAIKLSSGANIDTFISKVLDVQVGETRELLVSSGTTRYYYTVATSLTLRGATFMIFVLLISALIVLNTMLGAITSRMKEIEIWASVGANPSHIKYNFLIESFIFGLVGGTFGYLGAIGFAFLGTFLNFPTSLTPDKLDFNWLFVTVVIAIVVCLIASIYPSKKASTAVVPSLKRSWKPGLSKMLTQQYSFDEEEIPITVEPDDFNDYANYIQTKMEIPTFFKVKRKWPVKDLKQPDGSIKHSFKLDVAVFSAEGTYALIEIWSIEKPEAEEKVMKVFAKVNPYSSFGESSNWAQSSTNFNKACFDTLDMLRQLSLKWRVEGRKLKIVRD